MASPYTVAWERVRTCERRRWRQRGGILRPSWMKRGIPGVFLCIWPKDMTSGIARCQFNQREIERERERHATQLPKPKHKRNRPQKNTKTPPNYQDQSTKGMESTSIWTELPPHWLGIGVQAFHVHWTDIKAINNKCLWAVDSWDAYLGDSVTPKFGGAVVLNVDDLVFFFPSLSDFCWSFAYQLHNEVVNDTLWPQKNEETCPKSSTNSILIHKPEST